MPFADAPGTSLYFESTGTGPPVVFVHETAADLRSWEAQIRWFSRFHTCIAFNARGYRPSERSAHAADYRQLAADIGHVMDAAGVDAAIIIGFSMGAYVTMAFALAQPARTRAIVLAGLGTGSDNPAVFRTNALTLAADLRRRGMDAAVDAMALGPHRVQLRGKDRRTWDEFVTQLRGMDADGLADVMQHCHASRPPVYAFEAALRTLKVPTLIAVGDEDAGCLAPALFMKKSISASGLWVCPRSGHAINLEEPALFNAAVQNFIHALEHGAWGERDLDSPPPRP